MRVDLSYLREMSGGNQSLILEMIDIFKNQVKEFSEGLETHYEKKEFEKLGKLAHKAKSSVSIMGLNDLASDLKRLELSAKAGKEQEKYQSIINRFKLDTTEAVKELEEVTRNLELYI
ncbi:MAG: Hpt domain-containing protein [Bacteroidales bacterium]|nr:Hpt domain-containing protein [Bacteroidales bacterium]